MPFAQLALTLFSGPWNAAAYLARPTAVRPAFRASLLEQNSAIPSRGLQKRNDRRTLEEPIFRSHRVQEASPLLWVKAVLGRHDAAVQCRLARRFSKKRARRNTWSPVRRWACSDVGA